MSALTDRPLRAARTGALSLAVLLLGACDWFTDFKEQPHISTWESESDTIGFRGQPQQSVPITGTTVAGFQVSYAALPATVDSMSPIPNPVPPDARSLENGRKYYAINCAVCHGDNGNGVGPVTKYGMPGISIISDVTRNRTDGYIFGMIRNGRGLMPSYNRIQDMDRWDVVNYVRGLQGRLGQAVELGPVGRPGETGRAVPGPTTLGPTRPFPYTHVSGVPTGSQPPAVQRQANAPEPAAPQPGDSAAPAAPPRTGTMPTDQPNSQPGAPRPPAGTQETQP